MSITLNQAGVTFAKSLIKDGKIKNDEGQWGEHNPDSSEENAYLQKHEIEEYAKTRKAATSFRTATSKPCTAMG
jgi:hypothetical protein